MFNWETALSVLLWIVIGLILLAVVVTICFYIYAAFVVRKLKKESKLLQQESDKKWEEIKKRHDKSNEDFLTKYKERFK